MPAPFTQHADPIPLGVTDDGYPLALIDQPRDGTAWIRRGTTTHLYRRVRLRAPAWCAVTGRYLPACAPAYLTAGGSSDARAERIAADVIDTAHLSKD